MNRFKYILPGFAIAAVFLISNSCQEVKKKDSRPPFWEDIQEFKKQDLASMPPAGSILFIGSSSFTLWSDVQQYFPNYSIINRGFGSSTLADQIRYVNDIVIPYKPKQIVVYCGENDIAFSDTVDAQIVANRFKTWFALVREKLPDIPMIYISMKPSPSRRQLIPEFRKANELIRQFIATQKNIVYLDVHSQMLEENGEPRGELFIYDSLHMNAKGYTLWQKNIEPLLMKN